MKYPMAFAMAFAMAFENFIGLYYFFLKCVEYFTPTINQAKNSILGHCEVVGSVVLFLSLSFRVRLAGHLPYSREQ